MTDAPSAAPHEGPLAIICGGGSLPGAVAEAAIRAGRAVILFPIRGHADPAVVEKYPHHWHRFGQVKSFLRIARDAGCRDVVLIGTMIRPSLWDIRFDYYALSLLPRFVRRFRGGDDHLLSGVAAWLEEHGMRVVGAHEIAPGILVPEGVLGARQPNERDRADIRRGLALLRATGPFDIGQAAVVADLRVLAIEAAEGTDGMLVHVASMRRDGRVRTAAGVGVLVKAPKPGQDRRFDLPTIGPQTVEGIAKARLAGLAVVAGSTIIAEPEQVLAAAERARVFVIGVREADGAGP
jgi:UDP-2,3-diacylglucosamine hydrolase